MTDDEIRLVLLRKQEELKTALFDLIKSWENLRPGVPYELALEDRQSCIILRLIEKKK